MLETPQKLCTTRQISQFFSKNVQDKGTISRKDSIENGESSETRCLGIFCNENTKKIMNLQTQWIVGFVDGEGCFHVAINKNSLMRCGYQVLLEFTVTQHQRDIKVLHALKTYFKCGVVRVNHGDRFCYRVRNFQHLEQIITPFFEKHKLLTNKRLDFEKFRRVLLLMKKGDHLTLDGLEKIREIQQTLKNDVFQI